MAKVTEVTLARSGTTDYLGLYSPGGKVSTRSRDAADCSSRFFFNREGASSA